MSNVAIIGIGGIGRVHASIFHSLGANVVGVLSSTEDNANEAVRELVDKYDISVRPYWNLDRILDLPLDAVSICSPPAQHYEHIIAGFNRGLFVFCEKPLFWSYDGFEETKKKLYRLRSHPNRRLFLNISNTLFIDTIRSRAPRPADVETFTFRFNTRGANRGTDILIDLLPHGISLLQRFFGYRSVSAVDSTVLSHSATVKFKYGDCSVKFEFDENKQGQKEFYFEIEGNQYKRIQKGSRNSYRVFIHDISNDDLIELDDPFRTYISAFLNYCNGYSETRSDNFGEAEINLNLMNTLLEQCHLSGLSIGLDP